MCIRYQCQRIQRLKNFGAPCPWDLIRRRQKKFSVFGLSCFNVLQLIECMCFRHIKKYFNLGDLVLSSVIVGTQQKLMLSLKEGWQWRSRVYDRECEIFREMKELHTVRTSSPPKRILVRVHWGNETVVMFTGAFSIRLKSSDCCKRETKLFNHYWISEVVWAMSVMLNVKTNRTNASFTAQRHS